MKFKYLYLFFCLITIAGFSQKKQNQLLFTIEKVPTYANEFLKSFEKNNSQLVDSLSNIGDYLNLYINYKLKVKQALDLKLDTVKKYKAELKDYRERLLAPYLRDKEVTDNLVKEAYKRLQNEVNASHILIFLKPNASPKDTLLAFNKLIEARNLILNGKPFSEVAKKYSEDPSVNKNGGNLGYFTAFQMVYPFENAAFLTELNSVSKPFRTKFGYHILQVHDIKKARGEVEVAHVMIKNNNANAKQKIDSIFNLIKNKNFSFEEMAKKFSDDKASASNGGKLNKFAYGQMLESFSEVAFNLEKLNEISKPFETQYGWHIVKLLNKYPIESFKKMEPSLIQKVEKDSRSELIGKSVINKLNTTYSIKVEKQALDEFKSDKWKINSDNFNKLLLTIESKKITQNDFVNYLKSSKYNTVNDAFNSFKDQCLINYYKENIEATNPEFTATFKDFKEGLLLFDLLEKKVWDKSKDSTGLSNYFNLFKEKKYKGKELNEIKGIVINDYQNYLENLWIKELHKNYKVVINNSTKKKILKKHKSKN
ncbi:peptidylprolyl isomerase [uncultured Lutibacter sp.]|uniref:peptidylprolyl isomerase n=1 Tax=uncultured Lutibacter sp. TaxID=437739 RepID=UPI0026223CEF|nr:peptidylprolyl isomerase [uncultured Lutibacter sp.]